MNKPKTHMRLIDAELDDARAKKLTQTFPVRDNLAAASEKTHND